MIAGSSLPLLGLGFQVNQLEQRCLNVCAEASSYTLHGWHCSLVKDKRYHLFSPSCLLPMVGSHQVNPHLSQMERTSGTGSLSQVGRMKCAVCEEWSLGRWLSWQSACHASEHGNRSLIPRTHVKKLDVLLSACNPGNAEEVKQISLELEAILGHRVGSSRPVRSHSTAPSNLESERQRKRGVGGGGKQEGGGDECIAGLSAGL